MRSARMKVCISATIAGIALGFWVNEANAQLKSLLPPDRRAARQKMLSTAEMVSVIPGCRTVGRPGPYPLYTRKLSLKVEQVTAIAQLDSIVRDGLQPRACEAMSPDGPATSIRQFQDRFEQLLAHARQVNYCGLLRPVEAEYVLQQFLSQEELWALRYCADVQQMLGLEPKQQDERISLKDLTAEQREIWNRLSQSRTPPEPSYQLYQLPENRKVEFDPVRHSAVFRILAESNDSLQLSKKQQRSLEALREVTQTGLWYLAVREEASIPPAAIIHPPTLAETKVKFLHHAEEIALLGILDETQEATVRALVDDQ